MKLKDFRRGNIFWEYFYNKLNIDNLNYWNLLRIIVFLIWRLYIYNFIWPLVRFDMFVVYMVNVDILEKYILGNWMRINL